LDKFIFNMSSNKNFIIGIGSLAVVVSIAVVLFVSQNNKTKNDADSKPSDTVSVVFSSENSSSKSTVSVASNTSSVSSLSSNAATSLAYKNGTYSIDSNYESPAGSESIKIKLTVSDDKIEALEITPTATDKQSIQYQNRFKSSINSQTVGKKIDDLSLSRVGGASLTTNAFNKSLNTIKQSALN
jgi:hypothetical protein